MRTRKRRLVAASVALVVLGTGLTATAATAVGDTTDEGLVAWYKLDETSGTVAANSAEGSTIGAATVNGGAARSAEGLTLDGNNDYVRLPDSLPRDLTSITVDLDVLIDPAQSGSYFIWGMGNSSGANGNGYLFTTGNAYRAAIASGNWTTEQGVTKGSNLTRGVWKHLTYTQTGTTATLFEDGVQVAQNAFVTTTPASLGAGTTTANYIGRSLYSGDRYLRGKVSDFRVYDRALSATEVESLALETSSAAAATDAAALDLGNTTAVTDDLELPVAGAQGSRISWASSDESTVAADGTVTQPAPGESAATVTLTATVTRGVVELTREFTVTVLASLDDTEAVAWDAEHLAVTDIGDVRGNLTLPTTGEEGSAIAWASAAPGTVSATGVVTRPAHGTGDATVALTATVTKGEASQSVELAATVREAPEEQELAAYFFPYFKGESTPDGESIYFAASEGNDPLNWQDLNDGKVVLDSTLGEKGLRDPFIIRSPEGDRFYLLATDLKIYGGNNFGNAQERGSLSLMIWESTDLVNWSEQRMVKVSSDFSGNTWAPEAFYDADRGEYIVYWASALYPTTETDGRRIATSYQRMMYTTTRDFVTFTEPQVWIDENRGAGKGMIDSSIIEDDGTYYRFTKDEAYMIPRLEKSTDLRSTDWDLIAEKIGLGQPNPWGGTFTGGEGPTAFKSNTEDKWYLFIDQPSYHGGQGYMPFESTDLESGVWTAVNAHLPSSPRHGTVLPVTQAEYDRLLSTYQSDAFVESADAVEVSTEAGRAPVLPATVTARYGDGSSADVAVTWDAVDPADYAQAGEFTVSGSLGAGVSTRALATVTVVEAAEEVDLQVEVDARCLAGKAYLAVRALNGEAVPVDVTLSTPYGTKVIAAVQPGKSGYQSFSSRQVALEAGSVTVTGAATIDGDALSTDYQLPFDAVGCS